MRTTPARPAFGLVRSELAVTGMNCTSCARHVESALMAVGDVTADVDIVSATAVVTHPATLPVAELVAAIEDAGYVVVGHALSVAG
jgi:P-type Cu+ transporter